MSVSQDQRLDMRVFTSDDPDLIFQEIRRGLMRSPREISSRFFYDDVGSELFERITELPEYYQTRTEEKILRSVADEVVRITGATDLIELGSGAATKTRVLLDAMHRAGTLKRYVPFDVSEGIVRRVAGELLAEYPELHVHGVIGDFSHHLDEIPEGGRHLSLFLGGTIGNFTTDEAVVFLQELGQNLDTGDHFLLGADLIKDRGRLHAAYNDSQGITAEFNRNALRVLNHTVGSDFDPGRFEHVAFYNEERHRIEMWLRSTCQQRVRLPEIDLEIVLKKGEEIRTEISGKYDRPRIEHLLEAGGFETVCFWTDEEDLFSLTLARKI